MPSKIVLRSIAVAQSLGIHLLFLGLLIWGLSREAGRGSPGPVIRAELVDLQSLFQNRQSRATGEATVLDAAAIARQREIEVGARFADFWAAQRKRNEEASLQGRREKFQARAEKRQERLKSEVERSKKRRTMSREQHLQAKREAHTRLLQESNGNHGQYELWSLEHEWLAIVSYEVHLNWQLTRASQVEDSCLLQIDQYPGGRVRDVRVSSQCNSDLRRSITEAVHQAEPLPYNGYESVFRPSIEIEFSTEMIRP